MNVDVDVDDVVGGAFGVALALALAAALATASCIPPIRAGMTFWKLHNIVCNIALLPLA